MLDGVDIKGYDGQHGMRHTDKRSGLRTCASYVVLCGHTNCSCNSSSTASSSSSYLCTAATCFFSLFIYLLSTSAAVMALEGGERLSADAMKDLHGTWTRRIIARRTCSARSYQRNLTWWVVVIAPPFWWQLTTHSEVYLGVYYRYTLCIIDWWYLL